MDNFELDLSDDVFINDFTIIYKGREVQEDQVLEPIEEIQTSKELFLQKLRYFQNKTNELQHINEILIHDEYPIKIFKDFIDTFKTKKIIINENNYEPFYKLSCKYNYRELQHKIEFFIQNRPDLKQIVDQYSFDNIDYIKEEKISQHLDICLKNENMIKFPIPILSRILNSPNRVINDHQLLYSFIQKVVKFNLDKNKNKDDIQLLYSSLDYLKMSNSKIDELFNDENFSDVFNCKNSKEKMKTMFNDRKIIEKKLTELEEQIDKIERKHEEDIDKLERKHIDDIQSIQIKYE